MSSGIESSFTLANFKIDQLTVRLKPDITFVAGSLDAGFTWIFNLSVRKPMYFQDSSLYLGGLNVTSYLFPETLPETEHNADEAIASISASIVGLFSVSGRLEPETEKNLVKHQIPAILFPYLRAAITGAGAFSGFGKVMLPLINVQKLAEDHLKNIEIQIVQKQSPPLPAEK